MSRNVILSLALAILAGCASVPDIRYYTLDMAPSGDPAPGLQITVDDLRVAEAITRKDIMIKTSPTEVEYYATAQWAASLGELVAEKLQEEFGEPAGEARLLYLSGRVMAFEQVDVSGGAKAHLKLSATLRGEDDRRTDPPLLDRTYDVTVPADSADPGAVVRALSICVEEVAAAIKADAAAL